MTTASPSFSFSGVATPLLKKTVATATAFTATLDDLSGVSTVVWSIVATDETTLPASYTLTPSGAKGSIVTITSLALGTAALLQCTVNGGISPATGKPSPAMTATALLEVLLTNGGSVGVVGETTQRSGVFGSLVFLNQMARLLDALNAIAGAPVVAPTPSTVPLRGSAGELKGVRFETGTGSASAGTVRLPDAASIQVRTADTLSNSNLISQSAEVLVVGDTLYTASVNLRAQASGGVVRAKVGTAVLMEMNANGVGLLGVPQFGTGAGVVFVEKATTNPTTNPTSGFILYVDATTGDLYARGSAGTVTKLAIK